MDERLEKALDISNYMVTLNNQKRLLSEQYHENLIYYYNGGQFSVLQQLICFCKTIVNLEQDQTVLIDDNGIPIEIESLKPFVENLVTTYFEAANRYLLEYTKLKNQRSVESIMDLWAKAYYYLHSIMIV